MNAKPNTPEQIWLGKKGYSWIRDLKVNGWLFVAVVISLVGDFVFSAQVRQWPMAARVMIAMAPFAAILLWARSLAQWIGSMDELHRRIMMASLLFAVSATFFVDMVWHRLVQTGLFQNVLAPAATHPEESWDIDTMGHVFLLTFLFYIGYRIFNRCYE
jgi:hypothetical protein